MEPKIVRVGGRSKSEILSEFNLREIARRTNRHADGLHWRELRAIEDQMRQNQATIKDHKQIISELEHPTGILQFEKLDSIVYQTLCFEFSCQLIDRLSSPSFFKLSQNDVCNIKENNVTAIIKKWFVYLTAKSNKKAKVPPKVQEVLEQLPDLKTDADMEELYDMDELMEHRFIAEDDDDYLGVKMRLEKSNSIAKFHVENMSVLQSKYLLQEFEKTVKNNEIEHDDPINVVYAKERNVANVRENDSIERKRLAILSEIFDILNEKLVEIPNVTKEMESLSCFNTMDPKDAVDRTLPSIAQRYSAYLVVANRAKQLMKEIVREVEKELIERAEIISQLKRQHEVQILKSAYVVGMTTTGAAKYNDLLVKMRSRIGNF